MVGDSWRQSMPRPPKHPHALRSALKLLDMTQRELADQLGVASVTIEKFINGDSEISKSLGFRISKVTKLDFLQLMLNVDPESPRIRDEGQKRLFYFELALHWTKQLVDASLKASIERDQFEYQADLRWQIIKLIEEYELTGRVEKILGVTSKEGLAFSPPPFKRPRAKSSSKPRRQKP
jgi:transcriptional regulator with XRE-family HTH domain